MAIVLHHSQAKGTAKLVLLGIANHDGDGGAWPTVKTLAKYANCSESQVQRSIDALQKLHEVRRYVQAGGNHDTPADRRPNRYQVLLRCPADCDRTAQHRTSRDRVQLLDIDVEIYPDAPAEPVDNTGSHPRDPVAPTRPRGVAPTRPKPSSQRITHLYEKRSPIAQARAKGYCGHDLVDDRHCTHGCPVVDTSTGEIA